MASKQPVQRYVARTSWMSRVRLVSEIPPRIKFSSNVWFLGDFDGEAVVVEVYAAPDIIQIRRTLASGDHAIYDTLTYRMDLATPDDIAASTAASVSAAIAYDLDTLNAKAREELPA